MPKSRQERDGKISSNKKQSRLRWMYLSKLIAQHTVAWRYRWTDKWETEHKITLCINFWGLWGSSARKDSEEQSFKVQIYHRIIDIYIILKVQAPMCLSMVFVIPLQEMSSQGEPFIWDRFQFMRRLSASDFGVLDLLISRSSQYTHDYLWTLWLCSRDVQE